MRLLTTMCSLGLAIYIIWDAARTPAMYRKLKQAVDSGDTGARQAFYYSIFWFHGFSAFLALAALGFDWTRFNPSSFGLHATLFSFQGTSSEFKSGFLMAIGIGGAVLLVAIPVGLIFRHKIAPPTTTLPSAKSRSALAFGDFGYLVPTFRRERWLVALLALSAGVCEEIVFRAWMLNTLHRWAGLGNWTLVLVTAAVFGIVHSYQGPGGVLATGVAGFVLCGLYVITGTLLAPIAYHFLIDLRLAVFFPKLMRPPQLRQE